VTSAATTRVTSGGIQGDPGTTLPDGEPPLHPATAKPSCSQGRGERKLRGRAGGHRQ